MPGAGDLIQKSNFSSGIVFTKNYDVDGSLLTAGQTNTTYIYFTAVAFVWRCGREDVWIGYQLDTYTLQYWNGSGWSTLHEQTDIGDKDTYNFEINVYTSESCTNGKYQNTNGHTWWRMCVHTKTYNSYYNENARSWLRIYALGAHRGYDTYVKGKQIIGLNGAYSGTPVHSRTTSSMLATHSTLSYLFNETSKRGSVMYASINQYAIAQPHS